MNCISYLKYVVPAILNNLKIFSSTSIRCMLSRHLSKLIEVVGSHIRIYLDEIFDILTQLWTENNSTILMMSMLVCNGTNASALGNGKSSFVNNSIVDVGAIVSSAARNLNSGTSPTSVVTTMGHRKHGH